MPEVGQLIVGADGLHGPQIDAAEHDVRLLTGSDVDLQRRLSVQFDGQIHNVATLHEAVGRRVGPSSGNVDARRAASPHYLVAVDRHSGSLPLGQHALGEPFAQQGEGLVLAVGHLGLQVRELSGLSRLRANSERNMLS